MRRPAPPDRLVLTGTKFLALCRGNEVVAGVGQGGEIRQRAPDPRWAPEWALPEVRPIWWDVSLRRLLMPAEVPLLEPGEQGLAIYIVDPREPGDVLGASELVVGDLTYLSTGSGFTVDGHNTVIYELAKFETKTWPACFGPEPKEFR